MCKMKTIHCNLTIFFVYWQFFDYSRKTPNANGKIQEYGCEHWTSVVLSTAFSCLPFPEAKKMNMHSLPLHFCCKNKFKSYKEFTTLLASLPFQEVIIFSINQRRGKGSFKKRKGLHCIGHIFLPHASNQR